MRHLYTCAVSEQSELDPFRSSSLFAGLTERERGPLLAALRRRRYRRDEVLFHQGDPGDTLHLVRRGQLKILITSEGGEEAVLTIAGPGDTIGELTLLDGGVRSATVVALEEVETLTLNRADFLDVLRRSPAVVETLFTVLAGTIRRLTDDVADLLFLDVRGRLAKKLLDLAGGYGEQTDGALEIGISLTQTELAGMVGSTRPRVNKLLGFFEDDGAIARRGRRIAILNPEALQRWVNLPEEAWLRE